MSYYDDSETYERIAEKQAHRLVAAKAEKAIANMSNVEAMIVMMATLDEEVQWLIAATLAERFLDRTPTCTEIQCMLRFPL
jgi:uncharacterized Zn finger protein